MKKKCPICKRIVGVYLLKNNIRFMGHNKEPGRQGPTGGGNGNGCKGSWQNFIIKDQNNI